MIKNIINYGLLSLIVLKVLLHWLYIVVYKPKLEVQFGRTKAISFAMVFSLIKENKDLLIVKIINIVIIILYVYFAISFLWIITTLLSQK
jgi:hypothetical protein